MIPGCESDEQSAWVQLFAGISNEKKNRPRYLKLISHALTKNQWTIVICIFMLSLLLGLIGLYQYYSQKSDQFDFWDVLYSTLTIYTLGLNVSGNIPVILNFARFLGPAVVAYTGFQAIFSLFNEQYALLRVKRFREHVVICGLGDRGLELAKAYRSEGQNVVVIELNKQSLMIKEAQDRGIIVIIGDATETETLLKARIQFCHYLFILTGDDGLNMQIGNLAFTLIHSSKASSNEIKAYLDLNEIALYEHFLQNKGIVSEKFSILPINFKKITAKIFFSKYYFEQYKDTLNDAADPVHIGVVGFNDLGKHMVLEIARLSHYANGKPVAISVIDPQAEKKEPLFNIQFPKFGNICHLYFEQADYTDEKFLNGELWNFHAEKGDPNKTEKPPLTLIIICHETAKESLNLALLYFSLFNKPIHLYMNGKESLTQFFKITGCEQKGEPSASKSDNSLKNIHPFGMVDEVCLPELITETSLSQLGIETHNRYLQMNLAYTNKPWEELSYDEQESNRRQAAHIPIKLRGVGYKIRHVSNPKIVKFTEEEVEKMAEMEHERWMADKYLAGFERGEREEGKKFNPDLIPYAELDEKIKDKDRNPVKQIPQILAKMGFEIYK